MYKKWVSLPGFGRLRTYAPKIVCTKKPIQNIFSKSFNAIQSQYKIDLTAIPSTFSRDLVVGSPIKTTCYSCTAQDVELHPLVKHGTAICSKSKISVKVNSGNEIIKQFCNSNFNDQKLYGKKKLDAGKSFLAKKFITYFIDVSKKLFRK